MELDIKGKMTIGIGRCRVNSDKRVDWRLLFYKGDTHIAEIYYHPTVHEYVLETVDGICLRKERIDFLTPYLHPVMFRTTRRAAQANCRRHLQETRKAYTT